MGTSPLDHPRLRTIEAKLDAGELDEAQHLLTQLGDAPDFRTAVSYLATRLLFLRGRLAPAEVRARLTELLHEVESFPEAKRLIDEAKSPPAQLDEFHPTLRGPPPSSRGSRPDAGVELLGATHPKDLAPPDSGPHFPQVTRIHSLPVPNAGQIPPAARVPLFAPPSDPTPSYVPAGDDRDTEIELGRYSDLVPASHRSGRSSQPPSQSLEGATVPAGKGESGLPPTTLGSRPHIRSGHPPPSEGVGHKSLFEIAAMADGGNARGALEVLQRQGSNETPEHALLEARLLSRVHGPAASRGRLQRLAEAPLLDPEIRASAARLLLEIGEDDLAFELARKAHEDEPEAPVFRLTLARAALGKSRHAKNAAMNQLATTLLSDFDPMSVPTPALAWAAKAEVALRGGDHNGARQLATRALDQDRTSVEAQDILQRLDEL